MIHEGLHCLCSQRQKGKTWDSNVQAEWKSGWGRGMEHGAPPFHPPGPRPPSVAPSGPRVWTGLEEGQGLSLGKRRVVRLL